MTVAMKITAIWDGTLCSLVDTYWHFRGTCYFVSYTEDGVCRLLHKIGAHVPNSTCVYCMVIAEEVTLWHQHHHFPSLRIPLPTCWLALWTWGWCYLMATLWRWVSSAGAWEQSSNSMVLLQTWNGTPNCHIFFLPNLVSTLMKPQKETPWLDPLHLNLRLFLPHNNHNHHCKDEEINAVHFLPHTQIHSVDKVQSL